MSSIICSSKPFRRSRLTAGFVFCALFLLCAGPKAISSQGLVRRDQGALAILSKVVLSGGGPTVLSSVQDITVSGNVAYDWGDANSFPITIKSLGLEHFRADVELPEGVRKAVVNHDSGMQSHPDGSLYPVSRQSAADLKSIPFPYVSIIEAMQDSSISVMCMGMVPHDDSSVLDVRVARTYGSDDDPSGRRGEREARDILVDPNTFYVISVTDHIYLSAASSQYFEHEYVYSGYQQKNGIMLPSTITERIRGEIKFIVHVTSVQLNSELSDADFRD